MTSPTLGANVIERINHARRIIAETDFQKSGKVQGGQSYNFIPIGQILAAVRKAHAIAGVTVVYGRPEYDTEQYEKRYSYVKKGGQYGESTWQAANGHIHVTIYGSSVEDYIELEVPFEAQDNSDKLTNKIVTNAERCLYRELYCIDEGDATDPEAYNYEIPAQEPEKPKRKRVAPSEDDPFFGKKPKVDIQPVRDAVMEFYKRYPLNQTIHSFAKIAGSMEFWDDKTFENCYRQLSSEGAADLKKVVL